MNLTFVFALFYVLTSTALIFEFNKIVFMGIAIILMAILVLSKKVVLKIVLASVVISFLCFNVYNYVNVHTEFNDKDLEFSAHILEKSVNYDEYSKVLAEVSIDGKSFKSMLYFDDVTVKLENSNKINGKGYFYEPDNKNGFNKQNYYKSDEIFLLTSVENYEILDNNSFLLSSIPSKIHNKIKQNIENLFDENAENFIKGLVLGDKSEFDNNFKADISKVGISHILVVSGLHISYLVSLCFVVFGKRKGNYAGIFIIVFFLLVVGYSPSIIRASIMHIILICANLFNEQYSSKKSIWIAFIVILMINPYSIFDVGFVLSFASSAGIIYFYNEIYDKIKCKNNIINKYILQSFSISVAVSVTTTLPLIIYFESISSIAIVSNMLILPIISIVFPLSIGFIFISFISPAVAKVFVFIISFLISIIEVIVGYLSSFKFAQVSTESEILMFISIIIIVLFVISYFKKNFSKYCVPLAASIYFTAIFYVSYSDYNSIITTILPVNDGECIIITYQDEVNVINCGSTKYANSGELLNEYLYNFGHSDIDNLIITSIDKTHIRDINDIKVPVKNIIYPSKAVRQDANEILIKFLNNNELKSEEISSEHIKIIPKDDKKIAVMVNNSTLTLHSFTNKMISEFLEISNVTANTIILSDKVIEDYKEIEKSLQKLQAEEVILVNDYEKLNVVSGVRAKTTVEYGTIRIKEDLWKN